jgi:DNA polymerase III subunit delta'
MKFESVAGHNNIKSRLTSFVKEQRLAHALLFLGPSGSGTLPLAVSFAGYILCGNRTGDDACGTCPSCKMTERLSHPDLHFSFPIALKKNQETSDAWIQLFRESWLENPYMDYAGWMSRMDAENKQGVIGVEESTSIMKKLSLKSYSGGHKIQIIWLPEKMNHRAANQLLKILEEPPEGTLFFLVAEEEEKILQTILSRTQLVKVPLLTDEETATELVRLKGISMDEARGISFLANGSFSYALSLAGGFRPDESPHFLLFRDWMRICFKGDIFQIQKWVNDMAAASRETQKTFLTYGLSIIRESLMINYGDISLVRLGGEELDFLKKFAPYIHQNNCRKMIEELNLAINQMERNANPKILFTGLSLQFMVYLKIPAQNPENLSKFVTR